MAATGHRVREGISPLTQTTVRARVYGVIEGDPVTVLERTVSIKTLMEEWGPYAMAVFHARKATPLVVGKRRVWIEIVP